MLHIAQLFFKYTFLIPNDYIYPQHDHSNIINILLQFICGKQIPGIQTSFAKHKETQYRFLIHA